ncbi:MAG: DUF3747 domain-containing protein [Trichodesmium sp.]
MKKFFNNVITTILATVCVSINYINSAEANLNFGEVEINQNQVMAMAVPFSDLKGDSSYKLIVLEQLSDEKLCWSESKTESSAIIVEPLLLNFNFSGICGKATDSKGYSVRVDNNDLSISHRLTLENVGDEIKLFAISMTGDKKLIGTTGGISDGIMKIILEPGWQFTKRSYQEKVHGHFYFSYDSFAAKQAAIEQRIAEIEAQIPDSLEFFDNQTSDKTEKSEIK